MVEQKPPSRALVKGLNPVYELAAILLINDEIYKAAFDLPLTDRFTPLCWPGCRGR